MAARLAQGFGEPADGWADDRSAPKGPRRGLGKATWPVLATAGVAAVIWAHAMGPVAITTSSPTGAPTPETSTMAVQPMPVVSRTPALYRTIGVRRTTSVGAGRF